MQKLQIDSDPKTRRRLYFLLLWELEMSTMVEEGGSLRGHYAYRYKSKYPRYYRYVCCR